VANLQLARGGLRGREIAVRIAMGASRLRILQQLLTESMLMAMAGGLLGSILARAGLDSLLVLVPVDLPRAADIHLDRWVFAFLFGVSLLTGALFGLAPALVAARGGLSEALKEGAGRSRAAPGRARLRQLLVVAELGMALVLLAGAGLLIATLSKLLHTDPGFDPHRIVSMPFWLVGSKYDSTAQVDSFYRELIRRAAALPGVEAAAVVAAGLPLEGGGNNGVRIAGSKESDWISANYREITPGYFHAMGIPLKQGRLLSDGDSELANRVVVVNETFARKYLQGLNSLGQHLYVSDVWCEVVGVVGDVKSYLDQPSEASTYIPASQAQYGTSALFEGWFPRSVVIRASVDPPSLSRAIRDAVAAVDPTVLIAGFVPWSRCFALVGAPQLHEAVAERVRGPGTASGDGRDLWRDFVCGVAAYARDRCTHGPRRAARRRAAAHPQRGPQARFSRVSHSASPPRWRLQDFWRACYTA
jgi:putative ABC transport system permease protein